MATVYIDKQTHNWKLKARVNGKDKRITLRKVRTGETNAVKPPDVLAIAKRHGADFSSKKPGSTASPNPDSMMEFMKWFGVEYPKNKAAGTSVKMERVLRYFRQYLKGDCPVASIASDQIGAWAESRLADPRVGGTTVKSDLIYLSALFKAAVDREIIVSNPVRPVLKDYRKAYPAKEDLKYLTDAEIKAFLRDLDAAVAAGKFSRDYADLYKIMLSSGMRVSAAVNLRWEWITPDWLVNVPPTTDAIPTKTRAGYTAAIAPRGRQVLASRKALGASGRVFPGLTADSAYWRLKRAFKINPHKLRHSFATSLVDSGIPIQTIGACLGQRDLKTTQIYARVRDSAKQAAVASLAF
jgi:integrase